MFYIICLASIALLVLLLLYHSLKRVYHPLRLLPSPNEKFLTGHVSCFQNCDHVNTLLNFENQFKEEGLYSLDTLFVPRYVYLIAPEFIKKIFADGKTFERSRTFKVVAPLVGNGMIVSNFEDHHWQRKLFNGAFTSQQLKNYFPAFIKHTDLLMKLWLYTCDKENGSNLNVFYDLSNLSFDIIGDVGFGYQFNTITSHSGNEFTTAVQSLMDTQVNASVFFKLLVACFPFLMRFFSKVGKRKNATKVVTNTLDMLVSKRKKEIEAGIATEEKDILSIVLKEQQQESTKLTNDLIRDNLIVFLIAGHETTSTAMTWCLYMLGTNLSVQEKLREDIKKSIFDIKSISSEEILSLKYLDCVVKETLRLHPPAPIIVRMNNKETKFGDYTIAKDIALRTNVGGVHMNASVYPDPYSFKPERFMTGEIPAASFIPFGQGIYNCIGKNFALLEIKTFLVKALLQFQFSVDPEHLNYKKYIWIVAKTYEPLLIKVKPIAF